MPPGLVVPRNGRVVADRIRWARTPAERARGLLRGDPLGSAEALVIEPARQIHTFGMRYALDVCFCDRGWRVVHVRRGVRPGRVTRWVHRARFVVEMRAGALGDLQPGDQLSVVELSDR